MIKDGIEYVKCNECGRICLRLEMLDDKRMCKDCYIKWLETDFVKLKTEELKKKYKAKITQAHVDGYNRGKAEQKKENAEIKKKVIDIFANDEAQQGELWKACGLRLVGWDYDKNQLDDKFMMLYGVSNG